MQKKSPEQWLNEILHSEKVRKAATILVLAGIFICVLPLLMPVQKLLFSSVDARLASFLSLFFAAFIVLTFAFCCLYAKSIAAFLENAKNDRLICIVTGSALILTLAAIGIFSYLYGWQWLDSDDASEMVLGKLLAQENVLVSSNWLYSTEIRLVYQTIFTMPLFKLLGHLENWALIRSLNIVLNCIVLILSYVFLTRQLKILTKWILISSFFLILPVSHDYWNFVVFGGYYIFFVAQLFCCLGLFIRMKNLASEARTIRAEFILFSILSFVLGVQGIRAVLTIHIPLLLTGIYIKTKTGQKEKFPLVLSCYAFLVCSAGYFVNHLLSKKYGFQSFDSMYIEHISSYLQKLGTSLATMAGFFGLSYGSPFFSAQGFFGIAAIIGTFILIRVVFKVCRQCECYTQAHQFMPVFFGISAIFNIFVFIIVNQSIISRYFIPFMVLYIPLAAMLFEHTVKTYAHLKRTAIILGITLFITGQSYVNFQNMLTSDLNNIRKGYIHYLLDNELSFGFATFWNANVNTELSNGRIEIVGFEPRVRNEIKPFRILPSQNPVKYFEPMFYQEHHQGESFLLLTRNEWNMIRSSRFPAGFTADYEDDIFVIIRFPSAEIIYRDLVEQQ